MSPYKDLQETELLALIKGGSNVAFDELYNRHYDTLFGSAYNILRDREVCMDVVQDIFVWFWEHREEWKLTSCKGYLLTAVKFKIANYIRNNKVRDTFFHELSQIQIKIDNPDDHEVLEVQELHAFIKSFTDQLPERCREIFQLSRYEQLNNKEIAARLSISEKTVENQITIALKKLRKKMGEGHMLLYFLM